VGEIYTLPPGNPSTAAGYLSSGDDAIHLAFDFSLMFQPWNARRIYTCLKNWYQQIPKDGWACNVLSNHDLFRSNSRYGRKKHFLEKSRIMAVLLLTIKGTPFIYYGEEIGMTNGKLNKNQISDPLGKRFWPFFKGRDRARTPMQWDPGLNAGFSKGRPWLPLNTDYSEINVEAESKDPGSVLNLYKKLISFRNNSIALQSGDWIPVIEGEKGILAYIRIKRGDQILVLLNFRKRAVKIFLPVSIQGNVLISTHRHEGTSLKSGEIYLMPFEATVVVN
jgi:alpha-glucosidase